METKNLFLKFISKNLRSWSSTGGSRYILQTFKLNQTFVIYINLTPKP